MVDVRKYRLILVFLIAFSLFSAVSVCAEMRIFNLQHRPADELAETVRALLSHQAKVVVHRNTLVVRATPDEINEAAKLVAEFDKPLSMLRITVEQGVDRLASGSDLSASGIVRKGPVSIGVNNRPAQDETSIFITNRDAQAVLSGQAGTRKEVRQASQFVTVLDGSSASLSVGRAVPFTSQLRYYSHKHPHFIESVSYLRVDTGFHVTPQLLGDVVEVEIAPFMSFLDQDKPRQIVFHELSTRSRIPVGAWYDLSQQMATQDNLSREILAAGTDANAELRSIRIRIDTQ